MPARRTYASIYNDGKTRIINNTPVNNFNPQGISKAFLDILALEMDNVYSSLDYIYKAVDPTLAVGTDLDKIGQLVGQTRTAAVSAVDFSLTNFYFYIDTRLNWTVQQLINANYPNQQDITTLQNAGYLTIDENQVYTLNLPGNLSISNSDASINYTTIDPITMTGTDNAYVGVIAIGTGPTYNVETNVLVAHGLINIPELRRIAPFIKCTNTYPIQNGSFSLNDAQLRYLITTAPAAFQSNELAIRTAALSVPGIRDIYLEKNKYGNGTISIIIEGTSPLISAGLVDAVKEKIQQTLSYGDVIFVDVPSYLGVELNFNIITDIGVTDSLSLRDQVVQAIVQYINDIPTGGQIIWDRIVTTALNVSGVTDFIPTMFKYGNYDALYKINKYQVVLRYLNQQALYNEKWYWM